MRARRTGRRAWADRWTENCAMPGRVASSARAGAVARLAASVAATRNVMRQVGIGYGLHQARHPMPGFGRGQSRSRLSDGPPGRHAALAAADPALTVAA